MFSVENRAYELILDSQNALWVLKKQNGDAERPDDCSGHDDNPLPPRNTKPLVQAPFSVMDVEDPLDVALRQKCRELWEKIRTRLARYCAPSCSAYYQERLEVIFACVRRAIYTDPGLMIIAQNHKTVLSLLEDPNLEVPMVERLWSAIKDLSVFDVRAAVDDVLRPKEATGNYVVVLGGNVYKDLGCTTWPFHAWGHMTAVYMCYSCVRKVCKTVSASFRDATITSQVSIGG